MWAAAQPADEEELEPVEPELALEAPDEPEPLDDEPVDALVEPVDALADVPLEPVDALASVLPLEADVLAPLVDAEALSACDDEPELELLPLDVDGVEVAVDSLAPEPDVLALVELTPVLSVELEPVEPVDDDAPVEPDDAPVEPDDEPYDGELVDALLPVLPYDEP